MLRIDALPAVCRRARSPVCMGPFSQPARCYWCPCCSAAP